MTPIERLFVSCIFREGVDTTEKEVSVAPVKRNGLLLVHVPFIYAPTVWGIRYEVLLFTTLLRFVKALLSFIRDNHKFTATGVSIGASLDVNTKPFQSFQLDVKNSIATVDFGVERAGVPFFTVSSLRHGPAQVEVKYSESFASLSQPMSDGPYPFALSLSNCFRVETFNISSPGLVSSPLLQGGQRWMSLRLLSPESTIRIASVGLVATVDTTDVERSPGYFHSDDEQLNQIWELGARAAQVSCVEMGSQPAIWKIDRDKGALVRTVRPSQSLSCSMHADYTLEFDTMITRGGVWWNVVRLRCFDFGIVAC